MEFKAKCIGICGYDKNFIINLLKQNKIKADDRYEINNKYWKVCKLSEINKAIKHSSNIIICDIEPKVLQIDEIDILHDYKSLVQNLDKIKEKEHKTIKVDLLEDLIKETVEGSFTTILNYFIYKSSVSKEERTVILRILTSFMFEHHNLKKFEEEFIPHIKINRTKDKENWEKMIKIIKDTQLIEYCSKLDLKNPIFPTSCKCKLHDIKYFLSLYNKLNIKIV